MYNVNYCIYSKCALYNEYISVIYINIVYMLYHFIIILFIIGYFLLQVDNVVGNNELIL